MPWINVGHEQAGPVNLHCDDLGTGDPVVLVHGWPIASNSWNEQRRVLLNLGCRVVSYDRRGCGQSTACTYGHDADTYAEDLHRVLSTLNLSGVTLIGHGMGAGEIVRYLGSYGDERVARSVLIAPVPPTPSLVQHSEFALTDGSIERWVSSIRRERQACLERYMHVACHGEKFIGGEELQALWRQAVDDTAHGAPSVLRASFADFRDDLHRIAVPTLVVQGTEDAIYPVESSGRPLASLLANAQLVEVDGGPHGLLWTHAPRVNDELSRLLAS